MNSRQNSTSCFYWQKKKKEYIWTYSPQLLHALRFKEKNQGFSHFSYNHRERAANTVPFPNVGFRSGGGVSISEMREARMKERKGVRKPRWEEEKKRGGEGGGSWEDVLRSDIGQSVKRLYHIILKQYSSISRRINELYLYFTRSTAPPRWPKESRAKFREKGGRGE